MYSLASLESVVTYGCPPLAIRICNLVSGKSFPATAGFGGAAADVVAGSGGRVAPSLRAFSLAAFSARSLLSASIWALTRARAFASSSFSVQFGWPQKDPEMYVRPTLLFLFHILQSFLCLELVSQLPNILEKPDSQSRHQATRTSQVPSQISA